MSGQDVGQPSHDKDHVILLERLLERSRTSEEATARIARQLSELNQKVASMKERSTEPAAEPSATPGTKPRRTKRIGAPGTFRPPVRVPVPKSASVNGFHVS